MKNKDTSYGHGQRTRSAESSWNLYSYVENDPMNYTDPYGLFQVQVEAGTPLNLEYAIKDINAWEMFQHMQILLMFQKNEILYYLDAKARETGSVIICYDTGCAEYVTVQAARARVPSYNFLVEGSIADWWHKFYTGFYFGTGYGQKALNYYADILADPQSTFAEQVVAGAGGFMSSLWLPDTYWQTYSAFLIASPLAGNVTPKWAHFPHKRGHKFPHLQLGKIRIKVPKWLIDVLRKDIKKL